MAKPIKETPILTGRDAVNFFKNMKKAEQTKVDKSELERIKQSAEKLKSIEQSASSPESKEVESVPVEMTQDRVIEFLDWINNNWFIPAEDSYWKLDTKNIEYQRTIPKKDVDLFEADELLQMFLKGEGEQ